MTSTIILCGGQIDPRDLPVSVGQSNAMIPVNGRPVIGWIVNNLLEKGINHAIIVTRADDIALHHFLERSYIGRIDLQLARLYRNGSIVESLATGLDLADDVGCVRVVLGDTLIGDAYELDRDIVYVGAVEYSGRWCLVDRDENGYVKQYIDKQSDADTSAAAIAGYYHFTNAPLLRKCVAEALKAGERELSDVLRRYGQLRPLSAVPAMDWIDFGHLDKLAEARRKLISSRSFNLLRIDPVLQTVTKTSTLNDKLRNELNWYLRLPTTLQVLAPRILSHETVEEQLRFTQEFYGYPTLAELFVFGEFSISAWDSILRRVLEVHQLLARHEGSVTSSDAFDVYFKKTKERLRDLAQDRSWGSLLCSPTICINGREFQNIPSLMTRIEHFCDELASTVSGSVIHGDLCFSNILFDLPNQIVRLIDPRGSFGQPGIYGDPRYDAAKLRHSACGLYDFIVSDMFTVKQYDNCFDARIYSSNQPDLQMHFDKLLSACGYDLRQIKFIEGLLFASMLPLHADRPQRQQMMFCQAVRLLNETLGQSSDFRFGVAETARTAITT